MTHEQAGPAPVTDTSRPVPPRRLAAHPETIAKTVLPNGVRVLTEEMPEALSVSIGFWVGVGARDEPPAVAGVSHFLEHLLFKGTPDRSARAIAEQIDAVGGEMNAYTAREHTAYYLRLPDHEFGMGLELLVDLLSEPALRPPEIDAERQVILEEILMSRDTPDDLVHTVLYEELFADHPLGREVLGDDDTVTAMRREDIADFFGARYTPANLVVAVAGNIGHDHVVDRVGRYLADVDPGERPRRDPPADPATTVRVVKRPTEQAHLALGWRALDYHDPDRYALAVANQVLGGGVSSRLFQEVREERGLVYSVFSAPSAYTDSGALTVYAGTSPRRVGEVLGVVHDVVAALCDGGPSARELEIARGYLEGSLVLGLEDSGSRMGRLASSETVRGSVITIDEHVERIRSVGPDDVARVLDRVFDAPEVLAAVGPFDAEDAAFDPYREPRRSPAASR